MEDQQLSPQTNPLDNFFNIVLDESLRTQIRTAAIWARICALCTFVGYAVTLVVAIFQQLPFEDTEGLQAGNSMRIRLVGITLVTVAIGAIINFFLYRYATATIRGMNAMDNVSTNEGFNSLRRYFKIYGVLLIIGLSLMVLAFLYGIIAGLTH
jgi:hypothetical protein